MDYTRKHFDPAGAGGTPVDGDKETIAFSWKVDGVEDVYVLAPRVTLAVNVALATNRPLLIAGEPGSGKTRLAAAVANVRGWQFYPRTVTSRTQAAELLWTFDALGRLNDATTPGRTLRPERLYVQPGPLWWGFSPGTARDRGLEPLADPKSRLDNPARNGSEKGAVVLIDEIDKADPDVPNDLLEPFDMRRFTVKETNDTITATRDVFLVLTTNGERELPPAFLRRCVMLVLDQPDQGWFERVALRHFPKGDVDLHRRVAAEVQRLRGETKPGTRKPSTAEFLDALNVCRELSLDTTHSRWTDVVNTVLLKSDQPQAARAGAGSAPAQTPARPANP
jgi:MoxR-like ATPase